MNGKDLTAISTKEFEARQQVLDVEKWLESERVGYDLCGSMDYCGNCVKAEAYPCARRVSRKMRLRAQFFLRLLEDPRSRCL